MKRSEDLIWEVFRNFERSNVKKSKIVQLETFWLFWGLSEALIEHETATNFQKVYPIWRLFFHFAEKFTKIPTKLVL